MNKPYFVGISGGSASGKTFFLRQLVERLEGADLCLISLDEYYKPRTQQVVDANGITNFDLPEAIDHAALYADLLKLMNGEAVLKKEYTFNNPDIVPRIFEYRPSRIVVLEGIFLFHYEKIRDLLDLKIYLQSKREIKNQRRLQRDVVERGYDETHVRYTQTAHVDVAYREFIKPYRSHADLVINNNENGFDKGIKVLIHHLQSL